MSLVIEMYEYITLLKVCCNCEIMQHVIKLRLLCLLSYNYRMLLDKYSKFFLYKFCIFLPEIKLASGGSESFNSYTVIRVMEDP